ncbi:amidase family protein [Novosphingobium sp.]|uniref:amidase family protein n=1 Tax=Novosphingobium sp. TaxID=1874826 RepID=UPI0033407C1A
MTTHDTMLTLSATQAVAAMREGRFTALAYAEAVLAQCAAHADLNAFITIDADAVRAHARAADDARERGDVLGMLHGLPVPVKDSINTADLPTTAGTSALRAFYPARDASVVARLRAAGAYVLGKTNLHELSLGWTSTNLAFGAVRNPWDQARIPGGSSGGTAAAIAAGIAPLGLAEDTQGSIRVPAALCGITGFRPTTGRYPSDGCAPISPLFDQIGPHARQVADLVLFDAVMTGDAAPIVAPPLAGLRLGIARDYFFAGLDPALAVVVEDVLVRLADAGVTIVEADLPDLGGLIDAITLPVQVHDVVPSLTAWLAASGATIGFDAMLAQVSPDVTALLRHFSLPGAPLAIAEATYAAARDVHMPALRALLARWFTDNQVHAMLLPVTMTPATVIGDDDMIRIGDQDVPFPTAMGRNIAPGSTAGLPGLVLPVGLANGLPVAIEIDGPAGSDRDMLGIGLAIEALLGRLPLP